MEVRHRQQVLFAIIDPCLTLGVLALGTMPVAAAVVGYTQVPALGAAIDMPAHGRCSADPYGPQDPLCIGVGITHPAEVIPELIDDPGQLKGGFHGVW